MALITLTTDFGNRDFYLPAVKGYIYSHCPDVQIVDITHKIQSYNIAEAAYILRNCYSEFPEGSIHLINVESNQELNDDFIIVSFNKHYFIAKNNGVISLVTDSQADQVIKITAYSEDATIFPMKEIIADAACKLAKDYSPEKLGVPIEEMRIINTVKPLLEADMIRGMVVYIDNYGNAITNISKSHFDRYGPDKKPIIYFSRKESIDRISSHYSDVGEGVALCLFGSSGLLEIALNKGNASALIGLQEKSKVLVEFENM